MSDCSGTLFEEIKFISLSESIPGPCQWQGIVVKDHYSALAAATSEGEIEG